MTSKFGGKYLQNR